ncbi:Hypothetical protein CINCED_3A019163 [Cinara cedri]|uniref:Uncharacterized protein n=1 Tax=Cinara cedri TaxID=506608 RepID=A0A5E4N8K3_9HEMI|nr:Hypothetical protein CINCED_3A019163 [Cinara cedri]
MHFLEITELRNKVDFFESKVHALESKALPASSRSSTSVSEIIHEFTERDRCKPNVIAHGIPESFSIDLSIKINEYKTILRGIFSKLSNAIPIEFEPIRFGKPSSTTSLPVKVIFASPDVASIALMAYRLDK